MARGNEFLIRGLGQGQNAHTPPLRIEFVDPRRRRVEFVNLFLARIYDSTSAEHGGVVAWE